MHFGSLLSDFNSNEEQGEFGEFKVKNKILRIRDKLGEFYLYNDIYVKNKSRVYQIDHILLTAHGIYVIETKAVSGRVIIDIARNKWLSIIYGKRTLFSNPLAQNNTHIEALKNALDNNYPFYSIVVFSENNKPELAPDNVINLRDLQNYLLSLNEENILSNQERETIKNSLDDIMNHKKEYKAIHKASLGYKNSI